MALKRLHQEPFFRIQTTIAQSFKFFKNFELFFDSSNASEVTCRPSPKYLIFKDFSNQILLRSIL
jgi:hypothetical protein